MSDALDAALVSFVAALPPLVAATIAALQATRAAAGVQAVRQELQGCIAQLVAAEIRAAIAEYKLRERAGESGGKSLDNR